MNGKKLILPNNYESTWLIGFRLDPDNEQPMFFTLFFSGDEDFPLSIDNYLIFFNKLSSVLDALKLVNKEQWQEVQIPEEIDVVVDIAQMLYLICEESRDESATIINALNIIFDLLKAIKLPFSKENKEKIYKFADYLTFDKDLSFFFENENEHKITRRDIHDIILWCIGAIVSKSKLLDISTLDIFNN